jgi:hypothetical protein
MRHRFLRAPAILAAALIAYASSAFAGVPSLDDGRGDPLILITKMSPVGSAQLMLGATVTVEVTVDYILNDGAGKVGLVVIDDAKHAVAETSIDVRQGKAQATLHLPFVVPPSRQLTVKALLMTSEGRPFAKDARSYTNIFAGPLAPVTKGKGSGSR